MGGQVSKVFSELLQSKDVEKQLRKYDPASGSDQNSPCAHAVRALEDWSVLRTLAVLEAVSSTVYHYGSAKASLDVYQAVTMETELLAHIVGEEEQKFVHFAATALKFGTGFIVALPCAKVLYLSAPAKLSWIWP